MHVTFEILEIFVLVLINTFSIFILIAILANSTKENPNSWFVLMTITLIGWVNCAYLGFSLKEESSAVIFYKLNDAFVAGFLLTSYQFYIDGFLGIKNSIFKFIHFIINITYILLALFTDITIEKVIYKGWGNEAASSLAFDLFSLYSLIFTCILISLFTFKYFKYMERKKKQVKYFLIGTGLLIAMNIVFNVLSPLIFGTERYQHFGDYSAVLFLILTAYAILQHRFLNVKIALPALLIGLVGMFLVIDIIVLSNSLLEQGVKLLIFILFVIISVLLVRSVLREISQREQLARANIALKRSEQRYFDLASEQKDVIDVMGHEIRTPLTAIVQEIKIHQKYTLPIEKKLLDEAKGKKELSKVLPLLLDTIKTTDRASGHAVSLVTDMLETARLDKKRFELNYEKFDLIDTIQSNVELMKKTVDADTDAVKYDINFERPSMKELIVEADKTRIGQAVFALLSNAIKYHDPNKDTVKVSISLIQKNNHAQIRITDNGIGIAAEDISKLGKKFVRLNPKTDGNLKRPGGTGLGLFVVKGIMEYHHGTLQIESDGIGKGSVFTLKFPVNRTNNGKNE